MNLPADLCGRFVGLCYYFKPQGEILFESKELLIFNGIKISI